MRHGLGQEDFSRLLAYVQEKTGMTLPDTNYGDTERFVLERLEALQRPFNDYLSLLDRDAAERAAFVNVVTISETYFFREERQFSLLLSVILPELCARGRFPVRMWSAACATGEEPLSLYLIGKEALGSEDSLIVCASDIDAHALSLFAEGRYSANSFRTDGTRYHGLVKAVAADSGGMTVIPERIISRIPRAVVNLDQLRDSPFGSQFDVILLRNVLIYFGGEARKRIIDRIVDLLVEGGTLLLSSTEIPLIGHRALEVIERDGVFYFRKKTAEEKRAGIVINASLLRDVKREEVEAKAKTCKQLPASFDRAIAHVNAKLSNRLFTLTDDPSYELALRLIEVIYLVNSQELERAQPALRDLERSAGLHEVICYLDGYIMMARSDITGAIREFGRAVDHNPRCWPARYWRAILLARSGEMRRSRKEFGKCITDIDAYVAQNRYEYEFLLEGFNGKYFRRMCEGWLEKTVSTGKTV